MPRRISTQHTLETIKGPRAPNMFDFQAIPSKAELDLIQGNIFFSGRCVHLNNVGEWELGVRSHDLPFFLLGNSDDLDVKNDGGNPTAGDPLAEADAWSPGTPSGKINAVCALGGFELATTEFVTTDTYNPNDRVGAPISTGVAGTMLTQSGVLKKESGLPYSVNVVGVVTRGRTTATPKNAHGRDELYFASCFLPKSTA